MAFIPVLLSTLLVMLFAKEGRGESIIELGSWLSPGGNHSSWASSSGHFAFGFYKEGNGFDVGVWLVSVSPPENTVVWIAERDSPPLSPNSTLNLTKTGLWLFTSGDEDQNLISSFEGVTSASMLDSGNFVFYNDTRQTIVWQSFDEPTDTILGGQNLSRGDYLVSSVSKSNHSSGLFYLIMQSDGNLAAYPVNSPENSGDAYWTANTRDFSQVSLSVSGFLCFRGYGGPGPSICPSRNGYRACLKSMHSHNSHNYRQCFNNRISPGRKSQNTSSIYRATLDADGNLRLYEHKFESNGSSHVQQLWSTSLEQCQIKGFCGFNSYCSNVTGHAVCNCFPGFRPSKSSNNLSLDCVLADTKDGCQSSKDPTILYKITHFENLSWGDDSNIPYSIIPMKKEDCEKSFLKDCDCRAVLYSDGNCKKIQTSVDLWQRDSKCINRGPLQEAFWKCHKFKSKQLPTEV